MASNCCGSGYKNKVKPECEVFFENDVDTLETRYEQCDKNPKHENFFSVDKLTVKDLPLEFRTTKTINEIFLRCALTVRVKVRYASLDRPPVCADSDTPYPFYKFRGNNRAIIYGTGSIVEVYYNQPITGKPCPCRLCKESDEPKTVFWWVRARTATHVIHDRSEAEQAEFECFFDSDGSPGVKTIYGFDTFNIMNRYARTFRYDVCDVLCATHDHDTAAMFNAIIPASTFLNPPVYFPTCSPSKVIVSHPHGCSKRITIGNVLHMTVPTGPDYPTNEPIPFKKGTFYRQVNRKTTESENDENVPKKRPLETDDELDCALERPPETSDESMDCALDPDVCIMKDKLNVIRDSIGPRDEMETHQAADVTNLTTFSGLNCREKYTVQIYLLFIRQHILKILVHAAVLDQKCKGGVASYEQLVKRAFDEFFRTFLGKEYHPIFDFKVENESEAHNARLQYWVTLLRECEDNFIQFKARHVGGSGDIRQSESVIVAWFHEVETIMDSMILDEKKKGVSLSEDMLPTLIDRTLQAGLEILATHEDSLMSNKVDKKSEREGVEMDEGEDVKEEGKEGEGNEGEEKEGEEMEGKGKEGEEENEEEKEGEDENERGYKTTDGKYVGQSEGTDDANGNQIPEGSTFTLHPDAEYAFRVYSRRPGWFTFPPGTTMILRDGTHEDIGVQFYEFKNHDIQPEQCFVTYNARTCPGSSGANVYCDILGPYLGTYFPHSGHTGGTIHQSGIRHNYYTLYTKMALHKAHDAPDHGMARTQQTLIEGSQSFIQTLKYKLKKH